LGAGQAPAAVVPPVIPGYEILGVLGRGGMGVVYKARQKSLQRLVALKMILVGAHASAEHLTRFRTEAEAVARLQHPNVVQIHEVGEHDGLPFFSLEFVEGGSLADHLDGTPWPPRQGAQLVETLARAMHAAHQRGIVHRDLKPGNILLQTQAQGLQSLGLDLGVPKITDFGLAKKLDGTGPTASGALLGTPSYMAPEQTGHQSQAIGPATDVYALGAILYELLTGRPPFKGATPMDTVLQVVSEELVPPGRLQPKMPCDLETICLKCLEKEPAKRYTTAQDLADDLHRFLQGEPIRARPISTWESGVKWVRRRPALAALIAVSGLAVLSLAVGTVWHQARLSAALRAAEEQRDKAQDHFQLARNAVDEMLTEVGAEWLRDIPETEPVRQALLQKALVFYQKFLQEQGGNPEIQRQAGKAYRRVGDIEQLLGHHTEAEKAHHQSIETLAHLVEDFPGGADYAWDLAASHQHLGRLYNSAGQLQQAETAFRQALEIAEKQVRENPEDRQHQPDLATSYGLLGRLCCNRGWVKPAEAEAALGKAFAIWDRLAAEHQADGGYQYELAVSYDDLGVFYRATEKPDQAAEVLRKAIDIKERLVRASPLVTRYQSGLASSYINLGCVLPAEQAEKPFRQALDIEDKLAGKHPHVTTYQRDVGLIYHNLGVCYRDTKRPEQAEAAYHKDVEVAEKLVRDHPTVTEFAVYLAGTCGNMGNILSHHHKSQAALEWYTRAIHLLEPVVKQAEPNARARRYLSNIHHTRASALAELGRHADALQDCERALQFADARRKQDILYEMACIHSLASEAARQDKALVPADRDQQAERHAADAVGLLVQLHTAGYFKSAAALKHAKKDKDLDPLRSRADYREWLAKVEAKAKPAPK
jgi:tetratricopeptide (TPR) repeat protein/tRNA A-37 threonylcarbamoyl transferase component Bud32